MKAHTSLPYSSSEGIQKRTLTPSKTARKWNDSANLNEKDMALLDFSYKTDPHSSERTLDSLVDSSALGMRAKNGFYEVADYEDRRESSLTKADTARASGEDSEDAIITTLAAAKLSDNERNANASSAASSKSTFQSFLTKLGTSTGFTSKAITTSDLQPALNVMREHLMNKNVARDIADKVCDSVGQSLVGKKTSGFGDGGVRAEVRGAIEASLTRILTSKTSTDILLDISRKGQSSRSVSSSNKGTAKGDPYTITFVGVNGVGKSTNLSKVAFWLLQNRLKVLIAACDTFRSGAVEQLRVHVKNLGKLKVHDDNLNGNDGIEGRIELFEKGYGKDAAGIAKDAITYGKAIVSGTMSLLTKNNNTP